VERYRKGLGDGNLLEIAAFGYMHQIENAEGNIFTGQILVTIFKY